MLAVARADQRHLPVEASARGDAVPAVGVDQPVAGHVPQPEPKRHDRIGKVVGEPPISLDHHVLNDVAGIDPPLDDPVHTEIDHPPDRRAVAFEKPVYGVRVAVANAIKEHQGRLELLAGGVWASCGTAKAAGRAGGSHHTSILPTCRSDG